MRLLASRLGGIRSVAMHVSSHIASRSVASPGGCDGDGTWRIADDVVAHSSGGAAVTAFAPSRSVDLRGPRGSRSGLPFPAVPRSVRESATTP